MTKLIKKLVILGEIADLSDVASRNKSKKKSVFQRMSSVGREVIDKLGESSSFTEDEDGTEVESDSDSLIQPQKGPTRNMISGVRKKTMNHGTRSLMRSSNRGSTVYDHLDEWEEPELQSEFVDVDTKDVLNFRRAVDFINSDYPFSPGFGKTTTREECAQASRNAFEKLVDKRKNVVKFDTLCKIAKNPDRTTDKKKVSELVRLFRPNPKGDITKLEFIKSIDTVYKQLRLILANVSSSSQIDHAYGQIANVCFYSVATLVGLAVFGVDVGSLVLGLAGVLVGFAFMIGSASSKYIEGILLILVRRPYDIGDKICIEDANAGVDDLGPPSGGWIVENVSLYTTTVRQGTTREYATFTNGSLANSRILNLRRSEKPNIYMYLKFTMNVTQEQLDEFRKRITKFTKDRPREWIKVVSFRCINVETEQQYAEFVLIVQHREPWQSYGTIQVSKGHVYVHSLHLQKQLKMEYTAPEMPVHFTRGSSREFREIFSEDAAVKKSVPPETSAHLALINTGLPKTKSKSVPRTVYGDSSFKDDQMKLARDSETRGVAGVSMDGSIRIGNEDSCSSPRQRRGVKFNSNRFILGYDEPGTKTNMDLGTIRSESTEEDEIDHWSKNKST